MIAVKPAAIVIGASAGALDALSRVLADLPAGYALPVIGVTHLLADRPSLLAELLNSKCQIQVREAEDKEPVQPGVAYFAPPDYHLLIETDGRLSLSSEEPVMHSRPSIDVLFESAADAYGAALIGIVLTGANNDGSLGLQSILAAGGIGLVQCPAQAYATAMPLAALKRCPEARSMSLEEISAYLCEVANWQ